jgi:hypothetical protein
VIDSVSVIDCLCATPGYTTVNIVNIAFSFQINASVHKPSGKSRVPARSGEA